MNKLRSILLALVLLPGYLHAQQLADTAYNPPIKNPAYDPGKGPVVFIDEGHFNFHTKDGRYSAFARLLERDGYQGSGYEGAFLKSELSRGEILVISNALNEINVENWYLPTPSAVTPAEIKVIKKWVKKGGSLFLIADHMPMAGEASELAAEFGFEFTNGFAVDTTARGPAFFNLDEHTLCESTRMQSAEGWAQEAFKTYRKGRVVVFGEAAMFTAQLAGPQSIKAGMNSDYASENYQLLLNVMHWLDGIL